KRERSRSELDYKRTCARRAMVSVFSRERQPPRATLFPYTTLFRSGLTATPKRKDKLDCLFTPFFGESSSFVTRTERKNTVVYKIDRKSTRLNSSHVKISYAVFCLKKKNTRTTASRTNYATDTATLP